RQFMWWQSQSQSLGCPAPVQELTNYPAVHSHVVPAGIRISVSGSPWLNKAPITTLRMEMKMLAKNAVQKLDTLKPLTRRATSKIIKALITSRKNPKVRSVSGKVSTMSSGLTMALAKPRSSADTTRDDALSNFTPLKM